MKDRMRPALTAKEWTDGSYGEGSCEFSIANPAQLEIRLDNVQSGIGGSGRHALAALALHRQPFGFTWEDVDRLHHLVYVAESEGDFDDAQWAKELAYRIAALLPTRGLDTDRIRTQD